LGIAFSVACSPGDGTYACGRQTSGLVEFWGRSQIRVRDMTLGVSMIEDKRHSGFEPGCGIPATL
jgi:hypothetical protein